MYTTEINCIWSEDICIPDPTTLDKEELPLALDGIAAIRDCSEQLQDTSGGTPPGCILGALAAVSLDISVQRRHRLLVVVVRLRSNCYIAERIVAHFNFILIFISSSCM